MTNAENKQMTYAENKQMTNAEDKQMTNTEDKVRATGRWQRPPRGRRCQRRENTGLNVH